MRIRKIIREELEGFKDSTEEDWDWGVDMSHDEVISDITKELRTRMVGEKWEYERIQFNPISLPDHLRNQDSPSVIGTIYHFNVRPMNDYQGQYNIILGLNGFSVFLRENKKVVDKGTFHTIEEMMEWIFESIMME